MATNLPELKQKDVDKAILQQALKEDGSRLYSDGQIDSFSDEFRTIAAEAANRQVLKASLEEQNQTNRDRIDKNFPWDTQPDLEESEKDELRDEIIESDDDLEAKVDEIVEADTGETPEPQPLEEDDPDTGEKGGKGPTLEVTIEQREPPGVPEDILELIRPQIDPTIGTKIVKLEDGTEVPFFFKPPALVPIATLKTLDMFMEPISRKVFVVLYLNPVGFFYICVNIPCGYPIILPLPYPVSLIGPFPAGAIALPFIDPTLPDCFGSQPFDISLYLEEGTPAPDVSALAAAPGTTISQLLAEQGLPELSVPPALRDLLDLIAERSIVPVPERVVPSRPLTETETTITQQGGLPADFDFVLETGTDDPFDVDV